jgi:hypothetical protein
MLLGIVVPPVKFVTSLYYFTVSGENIGTSREVITKLSNLIMTVIVAYEYLCGYMCVCVWRLNQTVLELDFRAVKFCSSLDGIWTHTIDTLQHHLLSLASSALDHSTISWEAFLDPSDSYFLFADLVDFYTHWTYMLIFHRIFLSN